MFVSLFHSFGCAHYKAYCKHTQQVHFYRIHLYGMTLYINIIALVYIFSWFSAHFLLFASFISLYMFRRHIIVCVCVCSFALDTKFNNCCLQHQIIWIACLHLNFNRCTDNTEDTTFFFLLAGSEHTEWDVFAYWNRQTILSIYSMERKLVISMFRGKNKVFRKNRNFVLTFSHSV